MAFNDRKFVLCFLAINVALISSAVILQLLSVLLIKILEERRRVNNLRYEAIMGRNTALARYRQARLR